MSHIRKQIRDAATTLLTGLDTTQARVYPSRIYPVDELPCLTITTTAEVVDEDQGKISHMQHREITLVVTGYAKANDTLDDTLDIISEEVETALFASNPFRALDLLETNINMTDDGEQDAGAVEMIFKVQALTEEGRPDIMI